MTTTLAHQWTAGSPPGLCPPSRFLPGPPSAGLTAPPPDLIARWQRAGGNRTGEIKPHTASGIASGLRQIDHRRSTGPGRVGLLVTYRKVGTDQVEILGTEVPRPRMVAGDLRWFRLGKPVQFPWHHSVPIEHCPSCVGAVMERRARQAAGRLFNLDAGVVGKRPSAHGPDLFEILARSEQEQESRGAAGCPAYVKGEVQRSHTAQGLLPSPVVAVPRGLLVADFGVDWRTPPDRLRRDKVLADWLATTVRVIDANPSTTIRILGFSDCVGNERDNQLLRRGRAARVKALLNQMLGDGPAWNRVKSRIVATDAAPAGDQVASNDTAEGRARNRGVLIEHQRSIDMAPTAVTGCVVRPSQVRVLPLLGLLPNVPVDRAKLPLGYRLDAKKIVGDTASDIGRHSHGAGIVVEAVHWGITAVEIFAEAGALAIAAPVLAAVGSFMALGAGCAQAGEAQAANWSATGYSRGIVMGANGRRAAELKVRFGQADITVDRFCNTEKIARANYLAGLFVGYLHGRMLCPLQREWFWADLDQRMGGGLDRNPSARRGDHDWTLWYASVAGAFRRAHLG